MSLRLRQRFLASFVFLFIVSFCCSFCNRLKKMNNDSSQCLPIEAFVIINILDVLNCFLMVFITFYLQLIVFKIKGNFAVFLLFFV